jgi:hypothetical protein
MVLGAICGAGFVMIAGALLGAVGGFFAASHINAMKNATRAQK